MVKKLKRPLWHMQALSDVVGIDLEDKNNTRKLSETARIKHDEDLRIMDAIRKAPKGVDGAMIRTLRKHARRVARGNQPIGVVKETDS